MAFKSFLFSACLLLNATLINSRTSVKLQDLSQDAGADAARLKRGHVLISINDSANHTKYPAGILLQLIPTFVSSKAKRDKYA